MCSFRRHFRRCPFHGHVGSGRGGLLRERAFAFCQGTTGGFVQPLSTRYQDRERSREAIARSIHHMVTSRSGNHLVFFHRMRT